MHEPLAAEIGWVQPSTPGQLYFLPSPWVASGRPHAAFFSGVSPPPRAHRLLPRRLGPEELTFRTTSMVPAANQKTCAGFQPPFTCQPDVNLHHSRRRGGFRPLGVLPESSSLDLRTDGSARLPTGIPRPNLTGHHLAPSQGAEPGAAGPQTRPHLLPE